MSFIIIWLLNESVENVNELSDACTAQLVRAVDRQSKDPGSNPDTVESVSFSTESFKFLRF